MIDIKNLTYKYPSGQAVFNNLNLNLSSGTIYGLLGKNGAGKTTLIKNLLGLRRGTSGELVVGGHNPKNRNRNFLESYFFIPEDPYLPEITMKEYIESYSPFYPNFNIDHFFQILREFELPKMLHFKKVSFGQKKKALIAFAIATHTPLLIMDEPTNGLDIPSKRQFRKIISHMIDDKRLFIVSTHQIRDLHSLIDHMIILDNGEVIVDNSIMMIERAISFEVCRTQPDEESNLYSERVPGGYMCLKEGGGRPESLEVDMEVLFNAVMTDKKVFSHILKAGQS